eukprot:659655-Pyramimonas_sp.AAC.1
MLLQARYVAPWWRYVTSVHCRLSQPIFHGWERGLTELCPPTQRMAITLLQSKQRGLLPADNGLP